MSTTPKIYVAGHRGMVILSTQPDGSPRKLMDSTCLNALGWQAQVNLAQGLALAYQDTKHQIGL